VRGAGIHSPEDRRFVGLASGVVDDILARDPVHSTRAGDHRFDSRLPDLTQDGVDEFARVLQRHSVFLDSVEDRALSRTTAADVQILRAGIAARIFDLTKVRAHTWNPMLWNPADALYTLTYRDFAPKADRARALVARLAGVPEFLDNARHTLTTMPAMHVQTTIAQLSAVDDMLAATLGDLTDLPNVTTSVGVAVEAIDRHVDWLHSQLPDSTRPPALGPELYEGVLRYHLDTTEDVDAVLARAEDDLERVVDDLASVSAKYLRGSMADRTVIPAAIKRLGEDSHVDNESVVDVCAAALESAADFVSERQLVTIPTMDVRLEVMPAIHRGVSVAYCDAPGLLDRDDLPTVIAIAPAPDDWSQERVSSFYSEYNRHMIADLMVHEGVPGHVLQQAYARRAPAPTAVRAAQPSALFIEGWAVYAEEMMAHRGFIVTGEQRPSLRIQQLKMQLRTIINTILDIRVHTRGMTEAEARRLMATRGFQEDGEIAGKWRRAQLTFGQLPTYYLGYLGVAGVVNDLDEHQGNWSLRQVHDAVLSHGSVPPSVLRMLVGLE
jgi:uncharacterized protein (DUF885 family)